MSASSVWRPLAIVSLLGWASTAWWLWPSPQATDVRTPPPPPAVEGRAQLRTPAPQAPLAPSRTPRAQQAPAPASDLNREEALELAREELAEEQRARRAQFHEDRLNDGLERIAQFAEDERLTVDQHEQLDAAMLAHHGRMGALFRGMDGPPGPEVRAAMHEAREQFTDEVAAVVGDDLAEVFFSDRGGPGGPFGRGPR